MLNNRFSLVRSLAQAGVQIPSWVQRKRSLAAGICCLLSCLSAASLPAAEFSTTGAGFWTSSSTWLEGGSPTSNVPGAGDNVIFNSSHTVTIQAGENLSFGDPLNPSVMSVALGNNPRFNMSAGSTLTQLPGTTLIVDSTANAHLTGGGTWINYGTIEIRQNRLLMYTNSPTIDNHGTLFFSESGSSLGIGHDAPNTPVFNNLSDGVVQTLLPNQGSVATINRPSSPGNTSTFNNEGTVEVLRGILNIANTITVLPQIGGGGTSLDGGTWRVIANGTSNNSTLNILAGGTSAGSITTIDTGAKVVLSSDSGSVASFPQLGAVSDLGGSYYVHNDVVAPVSSAMNVTGTLGGDGEFNTSGGAITFTGGTLDPSALDGGPGTLTIDGDLSLSNTTLTFSLGAPGTVGSGVNDLVIVNGALDVDGTLEVTQLPGFTEPGSYELFHYAPGELGSVNLALPSPYWSLDLSVDGVVSLNVSPVPEPGTGLLLSAIVLAGLIRRRKQK